MTDNTQEQTGENNTDAMASMPALEDRLRDDFQQLQQEYNQAAVHELGLIRKREQLIEQQTELERELAKVEKHRQEQAYKMSAIQSYIDGQS